MQLYQLYYKEYFYISLCIFINLYISLYIYIYILSKQMSFIHFFNKIRIIIEILSGEDEHSTSASENIKLERVGHIHPNENKDNEQKSTENPKFDILLGL